MIGTIFTEDGLILIAATGYLSSDPSAFLYPQYVNIKFIGSSLVVENELYENVGVINAENGRKIIIIPNYGVKSTGEISIEIGKSLVFMFIPKESKTIYFYRPVFICSKINRYLYVGDAQENLIYLDNDPAGSYSFFKFIPSIQPKFRPVNGTEPFWIQSISSGEYISIDSGAPRWNAFLSYDNNEQNQFGMVLSDGKIFGTYQQFDQTWYLSDYTDKATNRLRVIEEKNTDPTKPKDDWKIINVY